MLNTIYRIKNNINGKEYIGFTSKEPPEKRFQDHIYISQGYKNNPNFSIIHKAIKKYGKDNFCFEILYQSKDYDFTKNIMEPRLIKTYNTIEEGYNISKGGDGGMIGRKFTEETKRKMSLSQRGRKDNNITKKRKSDAAKIRNKNPEYIRKLSEASKNITEERRKTKILEQPKTQKIVIDGKEYQSLNHASRELNTSKWFIRKIRNEN